MMKSVMFTLNSCVSLSLALAGLILTPAAYAQSEEVAEASSRSHQLQLGLHFTSPANLEQPFLNLVKSTYGGWTITLDGNERLSAGESVAGGFVNNANGLPKPLPEDARFAQGPIVLLGGRHYPEYFAGGYTLDWEGKGYGFLRGQPRELQRRIGQNRVSFFIPAFGEQQREIRFSRVRGDGISALRLYRDEHRKLIENGEVWNPAFINYVKRYDILRTMDMQATNASPVRSFSDVARPEDAFYGNGFANRWPPSSSRYGMPYEMLFDLAAKADAKLWMHIPAMIGAPTHPADPSLRLDNGELFADPEKLKTMGRIDGAEILASGEWEIFAREFTDRLVASGYPQSKPLYIELGNEVWNFALPFLLHTNYAWGVAQSINDKWGTREGYGALSARWAAALEAELAQRDLNYNITYVLGSQTGWPDMSRAAITGYKHQLLKSDDHAVKILNRTGLALTTYSSCINPFSKQTFGQTSGEDLVNAWAGAIDNDREGLKTRLHDYCIEGPDSVIATRGWVLKFWKAHQQIAESAGLKIIGAYEGGSHDQPARALMESKKFRSWWKEYHWGPSGADVVRQVNLSIAEEFPGAILSNYTSMGEVGGPPWLDGHYSNETNMMRMWDEFADPGRLP